MSNQSKDDSKWLTTVTIVTNISFSLEGQFHKQTWMLYFCYQSTIILNIWMYGCSKQVFPFEGPYFSPPLCCAQLAGLSVVTTSSFNARDRGLFAPIYVFSPITPLQAGGCQVTLLRCWWSPLWLVLPASCTIFFIFLDSIRGGLSHLSVLGPKCCLTPDTHPHHNANYYLLRKVILDIYSQFSFKLYIW